MRFVCSIQQKQFQCFVKPFIWGVLDLQLIWNMLLIMGCLSDPHLLLASAWPLLSWWCSHNAWPSLSRCCFYFTPSAWIRDPQLEILIINVQLYLPLLAQEFMREGIESWSLGVSTWTTYTSSHPCQRSLDLASKYPAWACVIKAWLAFPAMVCTRLWLWPQLGSNVLVHVFIQVANW